MGLQEQFEKFNNKIRLDSHKIEELREKRDILLKKLRENDNLPSFLEFEQGSYKMRTEVEPINKEYDIDVGLRFNVNKGDYEDPLVLKKKVRDILKSHTEYGSEIKNPCVTVTYKKDGEIAYHIDLVIYAYENKDNKESQKYLARGKEFSSEENKKWEKADPLGLIEKIENKYSGLDKEQYKRAIRYLKRWKNMRFSQNGNNEVPGIGITLLAYEFFKPIVIHDLLEDVDKYDDLKALIQFIKKINDCFIPKCDNESNTTKYGIILNLPVQPYTNIFSKMTLNQTDNFKKEIEKLYTELVLIDKEPDLIEQCRKLRELFGVDFEVPSIESESKYQKNYIPRTSESGIK